MNRIIKFIISFSICSVIFISASFLKVLGRNNNSKIIQHQNNIWSTKVLNKLNSSKINFENFDSELDIKFKLKICKNEKINNVIILKPSDNLLIDKILIESLKNIQLPIIPENLKLQLKNKCKIIPYIFHIIGNTNNYKIY